MRNSLRLLLLCLLFATTAYAFDYHKTHPEAWKATSLNDAAIALYGKKKFSTIKQTLNMEMPY